MRAFSDVAAVSFSTSSPRVRASSLSVTTTFEVRLALALRRQERSVGLDRRSSGTAGGGLSQVLVLRVGHVAGEAREVPARDALARDPASPEKQWITTCSAEPSSRTRSTSGHASRTWTTIGLPVSLDHAM